MLANPVLKNKTDIELISELKELVQTELNTTSKVLHYLREVELRRLHLAKGYPSLFAFCTKHLGYSEGEAHVRIQAMRLIKTIPQVEEKIKTGEISLSVAASAQGCFRREEKRRRYEDKAVLSLREKVSVIEASAGTSVRESEKKLVEFFPEATEIREKVKPLSVDQTRIEFTASQRLMDKLEKLKNLLAHKNFSGRYDLLFEELADLALKKLDHLNRPPSKREQREVGTGATAQVDTLPLGTSQVTSLAKNTSRFVPKWTRIKIWQNAQGKCQYRAPFSDQRCGSTHALQVDHIFPVSKGGTHDVKNLQLLCSEHNRFKGNRSE